MTKAMLILLSFFIFNLATAQDDPVLFTVEGNPVKVSEFDYIYSKNSGKDTDYSEKSLREYLDLYVKFKLKVQRAKELKLDTIPALNKELAGYRKQLAKSYLTDKEVTDRLIKEVYDRSANDVKVSHILFSHSQNATNIQKKAAKKKAMEVLKKIENGLSFDDAVKEYSEDKYSKENGGTLGFYSSMFPAGFYGLENAAYSLKVGEFTGPVQTKLGYHIVRLDEVREARGEMEVAHILTRKKSQRRTASNPRAKIDSLYARLQAGEDFAQVARDFSEDQNSSSNGGYIGFFGINRFEKSFENAAFELTKDNDYTGIVETSVGYHIIKRLSKRKRANYEDAKKFLKSKVLNDSRHEQATLSLINRIKEDANFTENTDLLKTFAAGLNKSFYSYKWKPEPQENETLFSFGESQYSLNDFATYSKNNTRSRLRMDDLPLEEAIFKLYKEYIDDTAIGYEEKQLEKKYPDFRAIMREYEEGILLFEVTKMNVWDKASKDTTGLKNFYASKKSDYMWKERALVKTYVVKSTDEKLVKKISKKAKKKSMEWLVNKYGDIFEVSEGIYERGSRDVSGLKFTKKAISSPLIDTRKGVTKFRKIEQIIPPALKTLNEARGYIEADYQDQLESEWVSVLKKKYKVDVNEEVLKGLIK